MPKRLNVILSAFSCSPYEGSENGIGWNISTRLTQHHNVTIIIGDVSATLKKEKALTKYFSENPSIKGARFIYVPPNRTICLFERIHRIPAFWPLYYLAYNLWQLKAYHVARDLHKAESFDIAHEFTIQSARTPGYLWKLGIPFVWGPISGAPVIPPTFYRSFGIQQFYRPLSRDILNRIQRRFSLGIANKAKKASKIFVATSEDFHQVRERWKVEAEILSAAGATVSKVTKSRKPPQSALRFAWSGLFVARKALPIVLEALSQVANSRHDWFLEIFGDGPLKNLWHQKALALRLERKRIIWHGHLPLAEAQSRMTSCDVLLHSALTEGTPNVVLEALDAGMPVVCHDSCGMGTITDATCAIKIPLISPETSICGFRNAISRLLDDFELVEQLSKGAKKRASQVSWDSIAKHISNTYTHLAESKI